MQYQFADTRRRIRWYVKKAAREGLALSQSYPHWWAAAQACNGKPRLRVLMYHRFGNAPQDPFSVDLLDFEAQLAWLAQQRLAVSLAQATDFLAGKRLLPDGAVLLTVDDGFRSLYSGALPLLRLYDIPAVAFVPTGLIEAGDAGDLTSGQDPEPRLTWKEIVTLHESGVTIASHGWTHRSFGRLSAAEMREEATRSRLVLEAHIGCPVTAFAYPFGTRADYDASAAQILRESGYTSAFTAQHGAIRPTGGLDRFTLPRIKVEGGEPLWMFPLLCRGGLDQWAWVDRTLWRLQARAA